MTKITLSPFDAADHLKDEEDIAAYLDATIEENPDDPQAIVRALGTVARARNMSAIAKSAGLTREGLYRAVSADGNPSFANVVRLAQALGYSLSLRPSS